MSKTLPERLRDAARKLRTSNMPLSDFIPLLQQAADYIEAQGVPQYDQQALELCEVCGWKTLIPDEGCLNCERKPLTDEQINQMWSDAHNDTSPMSLIHVLARAIEAAHGIKE